MACVTCNLCYWMKTKRGTCMFDINELKVIILYKYKYELQSLWHGQDF